MFVAKFLEIAILFIAIGYLILVILRFVRGVDDPVKKPEASAREAGTFGTIIGPILLIIGLYLLVSRLIR